MTSNEARKMWLRVAAGERSEAIDAWLVQIARAVVDGVFDAKFIHAARRAEAALPAIGWRGRLNLDQDLDDLANAEFTRGSSAAFVASVAPLIASVRGTPAQTKKRVEYARRKRP